MKRLSVLLIVFSSILSICATDGRAQEWRGSWIWCEGDPAPKNFYAYARKRFEVGGEIASATLRLTADSRYICYVNGVMAGRGPIRSDPRWQSYDEWNITPYMTSGWNAIAILVHHYGESTFSYMQGRGGLIVDGTILLKDGSTVDIISDSTWKFMPAAAWTRDMPRMSIQLGYSEIYDARKDPPTWNTVGFDDSYWPHAIVIGPHPQEPWPRLIAREIPSCTEIAVYPREVTSVGNVIAGEERFHFDFTSLISPKEWGVAYAYTQVYSDAQREVEIVAGSEDGLRVWVAGKQVMEQDGAPAAKGDRNQVKVMLEPGWNPVLVKVTQREGTWQLDFGFQGDGAESLLFSSTQDLGEQRPVWHLLGPFENKGNVGFDVVYPPEVEIDLSATYAGKGEENITWQRYVVPEGSEHPAVQMARAKVLPRQEGDIQKINLATRDEGQAMIQTTPETGLTLTLDFGREVFGYPEIDIGAAIEGTRIDIGYSEVLTEDERVDPSTAGVLYADRYICRNGAQTFRTFEKRAFRYLRLDFYNTQGYLRLNSVRLQLSTYPVTMRGSFTCSDPQLDLIWRIGAYTVQMNMDDAYTDCPWRERAMWWGDARVEMLCNYYAFGDIALARRGMRLIGQSQQKDGRTMGVYPTDWDGGFLPDYTLIWIMTIWDDYFWTGDDSMIRELFPAVQKALTWFEGYVDDDDLLANVPGWIFIDWAEVDKGGECAALNAFYYKALSDAARMAKVLDDSSARKKYEKQAKRVKKAFKRFWDRDKDIYRDARRDDELSATVSQHTNVLSILFGIADEDDVPEMLDYVMNPENDVVKVGSPYFSFYLLRALHAGGKSSEALAYIRQRWGKMLEAGATTWWETWKPQPSYCHGWSSAPTYCLPADLVGLRPTSPGWRTAIIEPNVRDLKQATAIVPTPIGDISAKITHRTGGYLVGVELKCPEKCEVMVAFPLDEVTDDPRVLVNGKKEMPRFIEEEGEEDGRLLYKVIGPASVQLGLQNVP